MLELARERPRFGYRRIAVLLQRECYRVNVKRVYRLWLSEGLKVPKRTSKKSEPWATAAMRATSVAPPGRTTSGAGISSLIARFMVSR